MLVLTRNLGESITIDNQIEIKILRTGKCIRIGIAAPKNIKIVRTELLPRNNTNNTSR